MKAIITIGLPASGKSTLCSQKYPDYVKIERDDTRLEILKEKGLLPTEENSVNFKIWDFTWEKDVNIIIDTKIKKAFEEGKNIILSDVNINFRFLKKLVKQVKSVGFRVKFIHLRVSLEEALKRDSLRKYPLAEGIIENYHNQLEELKRDKSWRRFTLYK